ncbi:glycosyltransferase [Providencia rettgeri]|nr:glycosyltransferase [Providencia rettgeri]
MNNKNPLVSVIIPCYNHESFIQECIQSVIDQDYKNIELIIIDDGSSDKSIQEIEKMRSICEGRFARFEFRYRTNKGLCATLNEALDWIKGEYTCSLASDDIWMSKKTSLQVDYLNRNHNCIGVFGNVTLIDESSHYIRYINHKPAKFSFEDILFHDCYLPAPTNMCRTAILKKFSYDQNIKIEDWYMWLKLVEKNGTLDYININLAKYRQHENNTSKQFKEIMDARLEVLKHFKHHKRINYAKACAYLIAANDNLLSNKKESLSYYMKYLDQNPINFFRLKSLKYLAKYALI